MMKKLRNVVSVLFFILTASLLYGQHSQQGVADVIVLMDTSGTILPYYEAINKRVLPSIISKFVRKGDSFHLLSFNAVPRYEMSQKINTEADLSRIVSRFMLLYQLGQSADFLSGINFAGQYMEKLPVEQEKILIIISDGIFNPPSSSPYRHYTGEQVKTELAKAAASIRSQGWKVYYVKLPFPSEAVIQDLDGTFYAGKLNAAGTLDSTGVTNTKPHTATDTAINHTRDKSSSDSTTMPSVAPSTQTNQNRPASNNTAASAQTKTDSRMPVQNTSVQNTSSNHSTETSTKENHATQTDASEVIGAATGNSRNNLHTANTASPHNASGTGNSTAAVNENPAQETLTAPTQSNGADNPKVYTDVSDPFSENLGIEPSIFSAEEAIQFNDSAAPLITVTFPKHIAASNSVLDIPLSIINNANESTELHIQSIVIDTGVTTEKQMLKNIVLHLQPQMQEALTLQAVLPDNSFSEGQQSIDIRLDFVQDNRSFSQGASVLLTINPAPIMQIFDGILVRTILIVLVILFLLFLLLLLLHHRRSTTSAHRPIKRTTQNDVQQHESNEHNSITYTNKKYYPEYLANKEDPRNSLNAFSSQTAALSAANQQKTASQIDYLAQEHTRNKEGRFALLNSAENRINRRAGFTPTDHNKRLKIQRSESGMTELFVYNQTTSIGRRNIHVMKPGSTMSIGGSKSDDFLIFLVPFPANLAQIRYDGQEYHLTILKPEYFPYEQSTTIRNCIGRTITVVSQKGYHVTFVFRGYEDPMIKLNMILTSINLPH